MLENLNKKINENKNELNEWFSQIYSDTEFPLYGSLDIRFSGWKVSVVDANFFPAGFNNLSRDLIPKLSHNIKNYFNNKYPEIKSIHIFPESHTRNIGYVENILRLKEITEKAGFNVTIGSPELNGYKILEGLTEDLILDEVSVGENNILEVNGKMPDLILLNNDLTAGIIPGLAGVVDPPVKMGWQKRRKSNHYIHLEKLVNEVSEILQIDPWFLMPLWKVCEEKCLEFENCTEKLAKDIDELLEKIKIKYASYGIESEPVVFVKNDRGTYGLGIISVKNGDEIKNLSKRKIKRLTYGKGGTFAENFLIQEGIPTSLINGESVLEHVGYTIGGKETNWFLRSNNKKNKFENLNSSSSKFLLPKQVNQELFEREKLDWIDLVSKLSFIAMGREMNED